MILIVFLIENRYNMQLSTEKLFGYIWVGLTERRIYGCMDACMQ